MSGFTTLLNTQVLNHLFSKETLQPLSFELALFIHDKSTDEFYEPTDKDYKRLFVPSNYWGRGSQGEIINIEQIVFDKLTEQVTISAIGFYEYPDGDTLLLFKVLETEFFCPKGEENTFYPGDLKIRLR